VTGLVVSRKAGGRFVASRRSSRFVSAALALTLLLGTAPAFAADSPATVGYHVTVSGTDLYGTPLTDVPAAIVVACPTPTLAPLAVTAVGSTFTIEVTAAVTCDVAGMTAEVLAATEDTAVAPAWSADTTAVAAFVRRVAKVVDRKPVDAQRTVKKRRLRVSAPVDGRAVDQAAAIVLVTSAISAEISADGTSQPVVAIPMKKLAAKGPLSLGKTIIVVLSQRKVYLYKNSTLEKSYRCAVGQRRYPTPLGKWKIVRKVKNPSWYNNGAAWAKRMPWYIPPGRNNPLGTRALYLDAAGIRIHGIPASENRSIGHAASHGCIRLKNSDAVNLFPRVPVGTPVYIVK
jgi:lipoprotein-anchoring transpeptidase ErfK/SrfK